MTSDDDAPQRRRPRVTAFVLGILVTIIVAPITVQAARSLITITDGKDEAQVTGGLLHVGDGRGRLTVNGEVIIGPPRRSLIHVGTVNESEIRPLFETNFSNNERAGISLLHLRNPTSSHVTLSLVQRQPSVNCGAGDVDNQGTIFKTTIPPGDTQIIPFSLPLVAPVIPLDDDLPPQHCIAIVVTSELEISAVGALY